MNITKWSLMVTKGGFTLIELIIVITIIAILAIGIIAGLNPIEQNSRARDARFKHEINELMSAMQRYYTSQHLSPFCDPSATPNCIDRGPYHLNSARDVNNVSNIWGQGSGFKLTNAAEVTDSFINSVGLTGCAGNTCDAFKIIITYLAATNQTNVCFAPISNAASVVGTSNAYWCDGSNGPSQPLTCNIGFGNLKNFYCLEQ